MAYFTGGQFWVNDVIVAGAMQTTSDRRIKRIVGLSDRATDRATDRALLNKLRITDYTYIDIDQHSLNVSATQKLARKVAALEAQKSALQAGAAADHASLLTLQAQMARLLGEGAQARK